MAIIRSFRDLDVYVLGREQAKKIFVIFKNLPYGRKVFAYESDTPLVACRKRDDCGSVGTKDVSSSVHQ
jgi:hypothetical protein